MRVGARAMARVRVACVSARSASHRSGTVASILTRSERVGAYVGTGMAWQGDG